MVIIVETDEAIRKMLSVVLRRAGFSIRTVGDLDAAGVLFRRKQVDAVICDVNLAPARRKAALQQLAAADPALLSRTVLTTTASERVVQETIASIAFAVVRKPFDIPELVRAVTDCAHGGEEEREAAGHGGKVSPANLRTLQHFVANVPALRDVLRAPAPSPYEMLLRGEIRRTIQELSAALHQAAEIEGSGTRAAVFLAASAVAADLASGPAPIRPVSRNDH
jgi:DNA-binding NtrC family response regulator